MNFYKTLFPSKTLFFLLVFSSSIYAQTKTNLELFYSLIDSAAVLIHSQNPGDLNDVSLTLTLGNGYEVFRNQIHNSINNTLLVHDGIENKSLNKNLFFTLDLAKIEYPDSYRDGFFGEFYTVRHASISGSYRLNTIPETGKSFNFHVTDSVATNELQNIENYSYPFTVGDKPAEPFFSCLFEPIVAIGATAAAVILFFTIRSK